MTKHTGVLEAMAECEDCGWQADNRKNAMAVGAIHARAHGHFVRAEQTIVVLYNKRPTP